MPPVLPEGCVVYVRVAVAACEIVKLELKLAVSAVLEAVSV